MNISELMPKDVVTCKTTDSLNRVAQLMWERRCGCMPVLDDAERVVGVLTDRDLCMAAYTQGKRLDDMLATAVMSRPVRTCLPSTNVEEVEDIMMAHGVRRVVVVESNGRLSGLVSLEDIARSGAEWDGRREIDLERVSFALAEISRRNAGTDDDGPEIPETDLSEFVRNGMEALKTLRGEIRVDLNLAGKEMRDRWRRLESRVQAAERRHTDTPCQKSGSLAALLENAKLFRTRLREDSKTTSKHP
jgi:CBS domain-containing protein